MSESSSSGADETWIQWFCALQGHEMFCEVERGYIEDGFNLYGLRHFVPGINQCLDVILDRIGPEESTEEVLQASYSLYGLIHARYVITSNGLEAMYQKYSLQEFGNCPRFLCRGQPVVPLGIRDEPKIETVRLYCPKCRDIYSYNGPHGGSPVDGAYFGTTFPHLFFLTYGNMLPEPPEEVFVPRVFGFRIQGRGPLNMRKGGSALALPAGGNLELDDDSSDGFDVNRGGGMEENGKEEEKGKDGNEERKGQEQTKQLPAPQAQQEKQQEKQQDQDQGWCKERSSPSTVDRRGDVQREADRVSERDHGSFSQQQTPKTEARRASERIKRDSREAERERERERECERQRERERGGRQHLSRESEWVSGGGGAEKAKGSKGKRLIRDRDKGRDWDGERDGGVGGGRDRGDRGREKEREREGQGDHGGRGVGGGTGSNGGINRSDRRLASSDRGQKRGAEESPTTLHHRRGSGSGAGGGSAQGVGPGSTREASARKAGQVNKRSR